MEPISTRVAPQDPARMSVWIPVGDRPDLADLRAAPPGEARRHAVIDRARSSAESGSRDMLAALRSQLAAVGAADAVIGVRHLLWADASAVVDISVAAPAADVQRAAVEVLARFDARVVDAGDLPVPGGQTAIRAGSGAGARADVGGERQWFASSFGFDAAHGRGLTGEGVRVTVVDSGIDLAHPQLAAAAGRGTHADRFPDRSLGSGHGTFVAGIVAGSRTGLAPGVDLGSTRTYGSEFGDHAGHDAPTRLAQRANAILALQDALAPAGGRRGADVVVASWGILDAPGVPADDYDRVMSTLAAAGVVVVAAAGNDGDGGGDRSTIAVPAQLDDVLAVGGVDRGSAWHPRASVGSTVSSAATKPDLAAPVVDIRSTGIGGGSIDTSGNPDRGFAGTSAAAPVVTSLVALLVQAVHDLGGASPDLDEVRAVLPIITRDVDVVGVDRRTGSGVPDASRIEQAAERIVEARRR